MADRNFWKTVGSKDAMSDLSNSVLGFLGCGKISSAVCRGFAGATGASRPKKVLVSLRSEEKSKALQAEFPDLVFVYASSEDIVKEADVIFIGLLPGVAREMLPTLPFDDSKLVISMMAAVDYEETVQLVHVSAARVVRTVPLPSAANRTGPVLVYPPSPQHEAILSVVSTPVVCHAESNMKPMIAVTGHISSFFELMNTSQAFIVENGVDPDEARKFVTSFYSSLAQNTERSHESLEAMAEEAATPGGLNEQSWKQLKTTEHFNLHHKSLGAIHDRLTGKKST